MKQLSCGVIFEDPNRNILIVRPTNGNYYQIPKGLNENNENYLTTAIRETLEETGIDITKLYGWNLLNMLGKFKYLKNKDLFLYKIGLDQIPDIKTLHCSSTFFNKNKGIYEPEVDDYKIISVKDYPRWLNKNLVKVFDEIYLK